MFGLDVNFASFEVVDILRCQVMKLISYLITVQLIVLLRTMFCTDCDINIYCPFVNVRKSKHIYCANFVSHANIVQL